MSFFQQLFGGGHTADLKNIIEQGAFLVDVRTPGEFAGGHVKGSVNIPLDRVSSQLSKFRNKKNIIVFCRSGARSGQAKSILERNGITNVVNGGTWTNVNQYMK
jgi:phage shock protein E